MTQPDTRTLKLRKPVMLGTQEMAELNLSQPTLGQMIEAGKASTHGLEQQANLISINAKQPLPIVLKLCWLDYQDAVSFLDSFNAPSRPTSAT